MIQRPINEFKNDRKATVKLFCNELTWPRLVKALASMGVATEMADQDIVTKFGAIPIYKSAHVMTGRLVAIDRDGSVVAIYRVPME